MSCCTYMCHMSMCMTIAAFVHWKLRFIQLQVGGVWLSLQQAGQALRSSIHVHNNRGIAGLSSSVSVGVPEALAEAMYLFQRPSQQGEAVAFQRQCVVVAQSEPTRLLMPWAALENTQVLASLLQSALA